MQNQFVTMNTCHLSLMWHNVQLYTIVLPFVELKPFLPLFASSQSYKVCQSNPRVQWLKINKTFLEMEIDGHEYKKAIDSSKQDGLNYDGILHCETQQSKHPFWDVHEQANLSIKGDRVSISLSLSCQFCRLNGNDNFKWQPLLDVYSLGSLPLGLNLPDFY